MLQVGVFVSIRCEYDLVAILYYSLTCDEYTEYSLSCIVNSQLMAVQLEGAVGTIVDKDCGFCERAVYDAIF